MLGATYSIPHGICSCLTLSDTIALMSTRLSGANLISLARAIHSVPSSYLSQGYKPSLDTESGQREAALEISKAVRKLLKELGLESRLSEYKVPREALEGMAAKVSPDGAGYTKEMVLEGILEKAF
jgi:alcohol dehydrogenase class IV